MSSGNYAMTSSATEVPGSSSSSLKLPGLSGIPGGAEAALRKNSSSQLPGSAGLSVSSSHLLASSSSSGGGGTGTLSRDTAVVPAAASTLPFDQLIPESIKNKLSTSTNGLDKGESIV